MTSALPVWCYTHWVMKPHIGRKVNTYILRKLPSMHDGKKKGKTTHTRLTEHNHTQRTHEQVHAKKNTSYLTVWLLSYQAQKRVYVFSLLWRCGSGGEFSLTWFTQVFNASRSKFASKRCSPTISAYKFSDVFVFTHSLACVTDEFCDTGYSFTWWVLAEQGLLCNVYTTSVWRSSYRLLYVARWQGSSGTTR